MAKKGFILAEAILAITLVGGSMLMKAQYDKEGERIKEADFLASSIIDIVSAVDRRVFLDGLYKVDGWDDRWLSTNDVIDKVFSEELVGNANPSCGVAGGWAPKDPANGMLDLLQCGFMQGGKVPFGMQISSERTGSASNLINSWKFHFFSDTEKLFSKNFKYYIRVLSESQSRKSPSITGGFKFYLSDLSTGKVLKNSECLSRTTKCAITAEYETNGAGLSEDVHLRVDGTNSMLDTLSFRAPMSGDLIGCKRSSYDGADTTDVPCGIEVLPSDKIAININDNFTGEGLRLSASPIAGGSVYAPVICSRGEEDRICGVTSVKVGGSTYAEAYLDSIYTGEVEAEKITVNDGHLSLVNSDLTIGKKGAGGAVSPMTSIDSSTGNIATVGNASVKDLFARGKVATNHAQIKDAKITNLEVTGGGVSAIFGGDASFKRDAVFEKNTTVKGNTEVKGNAYIRKNLYAKTIDADSMTVDKVDFDKSYGVGGGCPHNGSIGRSFTGGLLNCVGNRWKKAGGFPLERIWEGSALSVRVKTTGYYVIVTNFGTSNMFIDTLHRDTRGTQIAASSHILGTYYDHGSRSIKGYGHYATPTLKKIFLMDYVEL